MNRISTVDFPPGSNFKNMKQNGTYNQKITAKVIFLRGEEKVTAAVLFPRYVAHLIRFYYLCRASRWRGGVDARVPAGPARSLSEECK